MRHWHWASNVARLAGVSRLTDLDRQTPRHPLVQSLVWGRYFEAIGLDGSDPGRIKVVKDPERSLLTHVARDRRYAPAIKGYDHPLWAHLRHRDPDERPSDAWIGRVLGERGLMVLEKGDTMRREMLGLEGSRPTGSLYEDSLTSPSALGLASPDAFADLDGILVLTLFLRAAVDASADQHEQWVPELRRLLKGATERFAVDHEFAGEARDTWTLIVATRILTWRPNVTASKGDIESARSQLLEEREGKKRRVGQIDSGNPEARIRGRAERRWRRQIDIRSKVVASESPDPSLKYNEREVVRATEVMRWIASNRSAIDNQIDWATGVLIDGADQQPAPPPLVMPSTIFGKRRRPDISADWDLFVGNVVPFDVIQAIDEASGAIAGTREVRQRRHHAPASPDQDIFDDEDAAGTDGDAANRGLPEDHPHQIQG